MHHLRFSVACLSALVCLGTAYPDEEPLPRGKGSLVTRLNVEICVGTTYNTKSCGPVGPNDAPPEIVELAGIVSAPILDVKCPPKCFGVAADAVKVKVKAVSRRGARYKFAHWGVGCKGKGECRLSIPKNSRARVVAYFSAY
jgi:hypothetical protein